MVYKNLKKNIILVTLILLNACNSTNSSKKNFNQKNLHKSQKNLSKIKNKSLIKRRKIAISRRKNTKRIATRTRKSSVKCIKNITNYQKLYNEIVINEKLIINSSPHKEILNHNKNDCKNLKKSLFINKKFDQIINFQRGRIGIITATNSDVSKNLISGIKAACVDLECDDSLILYKSYNHNVQSMKNAIADLYFNQNVSLIIGGQNDTHIDFLKKFSSISKTPILTLNSTFPVERNDYIFKISPSSKFMASKIIEGIRSQKGSRLAIMDPIGYSKNLIKSIKQMSSNRKVEITDLIPYSANNYESINQAVRKLLRLNSSDRKEELDNLIREEKNRLAKSGRNFDIESINLKPIINFDYLLIPDSFKIVKHFIKLFRYHGVDKVKIIGNHLWRSIDIVRPWDPMLEGAIFADFVGNYKDLPKSLGVNVTGNGIFINPEMMSSIDFKVLGYRALRIAHKIQKFSRQRGRNFLRKVQKIKIESKFSGNAQVFTENNETDWQTYLFSISNGRVFFDKNMNSNKH